MYILEDGFVKQRVLELVSDKYVKDISASGDLTYAVVQIIIRNQYIGNWGF